MTSFRDSGWRPAPVRRAAMEIQGSLGRGGRSHAAAHPSIDLAEADPDSRSRASWTAVTGSIILTVVFAGCALFLTLDPVIGDPVVTIMLIAVLLLPVLPLLWPGDRRAA